MNETVYILRDQYNMDIVYISNERRDRWTYKISKAAIFKTQKRAHLECGLLGSDWEIVPITKRKLFLAKLENK